MSRNRKLPDGWKAGSLQDVCDLQAGNAWASKDFHADPPGMPVIRIQNLGEADSAFVYWRDEYDQRYVVSAGDLLLSLSGSFKACNWNGRPGLLNQRIVRVMPRNGTVKEWLWNQLSLSLRKISDSGNQAVVNNVAMGDLYSLDVPFPPLPEQRKIAEILGSVDENIEKTQALIAKLQDLKKATMQELLTKGIGHTKFKSSPVGRIPEEWKVQRLREALAEPPHNGYSPTEVGEWTGLVSLGLGCLTPDGFEPKHLKNVSYDNVRNTSALLNDGDVLISRSNTRELVALPGVFKDIGIPCIYPDLMMRLVPNDVIYADFLELLLRHHPVRSQLTNGAGGTSGSMVKINSTTVLNIVIPLPHKPEQKRIIQLAGMQDAVLRDKKMRLNKLQCLKKALMQDLLTGKVRVRI